MKHFLHTSHQISSYPLLILSLFALVASTSFIHLYVGSAPNYTMRVETALEESPSSSIPPNPTTPSPDSTLTQPLTPEHADTDIADQFKFTSELILKAINPGYTVDKQSNTGELIELTNLSGASLSLAGYSLRYTNGSGNSAMIVEFVEGSRITGDTLLLRYAKSPESDLSDLTYTTSLAMTAGPLELLYNGAVVDSICWTGKDGCAKAFKSAAPTSLVRNLDTGEFAHLSDYTPEFDPDASSLILPITLEDSDESEDILSENTSKEPTAASSQCRGLEFSEIYTYYAGAQAEQFIELHNPDSKNISLSGCNLRYKKKVYPLDGTVAAGGYFVYYPKEHFSLTKNPTTSNFLELLDADKTVVDELIYPHGQKKSASYAKFYDASGEEIWSRTFARTPGQDNVYQEFQSCPAGKTINTETGNCVKVSSVTTTECPAGKYRNPITGRCKKIETTASGELAPCAEGYERNPETKRCRKIKTTNNGADYALVPTTSSESSPGTFIAFGVVAVIVSVGVIYIALQFRREIARAARKARQRFHHFLKHLVPRQIRRHRDK